MNAADLAARIARWEDLHTEFKERVDSPDKLAKQLVAFANTDGGQIIIGVRKDRQVVGVPDPDATGQLVDNAAYNNCEPPLTVVQEVLADGDKKVLVVNVPKGSQRPYRTSNGRYYVRTTSGCRDASQADLLRLFQAVESLFYDETPLVRLGVDDLDLDDFERYLQKVGAVDLDRDRRRLLRNWGLLEGDHPTLAGALLFARDPQRHLPFAQINAARFPGADSAAEPLDRKDLTGRLLDVIEGARRFLQEHLRVPHRIQGFDPESRPELPEEALREAVVNAVAHRDYTVQGPVRLFVFDDRVEIRTPGKPPNTVTASAMRAGVHVPRNPRIYSRLADAGLVTGAGTGIRRISTLVRQATGRDIGLEVAETEVLLTIPRAGAGPAAL
ncbi:MAG: putative DNA binding domain-containing protein [Deltaproteobacteria bacterium]|nr:putative DNA binding domain-containing protein [Deltaproteobacteria bacterium]